MSRKVTKLGILNRHICCRCGRKRNEIYMQSAYYSNKWKSWDSTWKSFPQRNSFICIAKCLPFFLTE